MQDTSKRKPREARALLRGFNPWQKRIATVGILGAILAIAGVFSPLRVLTTIGFATSLTALVLIVLLGNRQNWRQLKILQESILKDKKRHALAEVSTSADKIVHVPNVGSAYEYSKRIAHNRSSLESFALRNKSLEIRNAFALAATANKYQFADLTRFIAVQRMSMLPQVNKQKIRNWDSSALLALARLQANQQATELDLQNAVNYFSFIQNFFGVKSLRKNDRLIYLEALGELGRYSQQAALASRFNLERLYPMQAALQRLNFIRAEKGVNHADWVNALNSVYSASGYSPVKLNPEISDHPLDQLSTNVTPITDGPLVSVIVPTYEGGPHLLSALRSLVNQSWKRLEIIVVDDGSDSSYDSYLEKAKNLSDRIVVIKQPENYGAYSARNAGLEIATGEYITVHDDDDWSHGDKIKTQILQLMDDPSLPGNMTAHVRSTEDLKFVRINNNPLLCQANFSSLMVHRSVFEKVGIWDNVNRGADSEFRDRIVRYFGKPVAILDEVPLSFTRTWEGSLTSGEMSRGFVDPSRLLYLNAYTQAHQRAEEENEPDLLKPRQPRAYAVPTTMEPGSRHLHVGTFDVVFMTDFRFPGGTTALTLKEIQTASDAGLRVGYIHAESPLNRPENPVSGDLFEMQRQGIVQQVGMQDRADIRLLVIRHPSVVTFMDNITSNLKVHKSVLIVNNPPVLVGGEGMVFDLPDALENIDRIFDHQTLVVAESGVTRRLCEPFVPAQRLADDYWPGLIALGELIPQNFEGRPRVGRHSRDHLLKWPSSMADFEDAYISDSFDTYVLGGANELEKKHGKQSVSKLKVYEFGEIGVDEFLPTIDFWVYFHDDRLTESFGMSIAEAMAAGKVVILPPYLESSFGDGAVYTIPEKVESTILEYWKEPKKYLEQSSRARAFVKDNFSAEAFLSRVHQYSPE